MATSTCWCGIPFNCMCQILHQHLNVIDHSVGHEKTLGGWNGAPLRQATPNDVWKNTTASTGDRFQSSTCWLPFMVRWRQVWAFFRSTSQMISTNFMYIGQVGLATELCGISNRDKRIILCLPIQRRRNHGQKQHRCNLEDSTKHQILFQLHRSENKSSFTFHSGWEDIVGLDLWGI